MPVYRNGRELVTATRFGRVVTKIYRFGRVAYDYIVGYIFTKDGYSIKTNDSYTIKCKDQ